MSALHPLLPDQKLNEVISSVEGHLCLDLKVHAVDNVDLGPPVKSRPFVYEAREANPGIKVRF